MGTKPNYFKIGLFILIALGILLGALTIFGAGVFEKDRIYFETYFDNSVHGLSVGSPVEARGVRIGRVERIAFVNDVYPSVMENVTSSSYERYIVVVVSVDTEFIGQSSSIQTQDKLEQLIEEGLRIRFAAEILTGLGYLEAEFLDPNRFEPLAINWTPERIYIPSAPGEFNTLKDSVDKILYKLEKIDVQQIGLTVQELLGSLHAAVADANIPGLSHEAQQVLKLAETKLGALDTQKISQEAEQILFGLNAAIQDADVPGLSQQAKLLLEGVERSVDNLNHLLAQPDSAQRFSSLPEVIAQLHTSLRRIDRLIAAKTPQIEQALDDARAISENLKQLTGTLSRNPSEIIFSKPPPQTEHKK
jgi:paraquat-inducible protein B